MNDEQRRLVDPPVIRREPNPVYESLTEIDFGDWNVRVWRGHDTLEAALVMQHDIGNRVIQLKQDRDECALPTEQAARIVQAIGAMERVSCVQIAHRQHGCGAAYFPDWP